MMSTKKMGMMMMIMMGMAMAAAAPGAAASSSSSGSRKTRPTQLVYYLHLNQAAGTLATVNSGVTEDMSYSTMVFDLPMTEGLSASSKSMGVVRGLSVIQTGGADRAAAGHRLEELLNTILYDDGTHSGKISQHGVYDLSLVYEDEGVDTSKEVGGAGNEMAVIGGTGDFRCATGYSTVTLASRTPYTILKWVVHLYYVCPPAFSSSKI